jgi:hypothetical protein
MREWIQLIIGLSGVFSTLVFSQVTPQTIQPFKSLCISDQDTGFNWVNGKWITTQFTPDKYILEKLDYDKLMNATNYFGRPVNCSVPIASNLDAESSVVKACYSIRRFGSDALITIDALDCYESFKNKTLQGIYCPTQGNFKPNGLFVKLPSYISMDLSPKKVKDSIALSVGTCGVL